MHRNVLLKRPVAVSSGIATNDHQQRDSLFSVDPASNCVTIDTTANRAVVDFGEISAFNVVCVGRQIFLIVGQTDGSLLQVEVAVSSSGAVSPSVRRRLTQQPAAVSFVSHGLDVGSRKFVFVADLSGLWRLVEVATRGDAVAPAVISVDTRACHCASWQPDQGPLCLTVIHGGARTHSGSGACVLFDERTVRRYALVSRCFGRDVAASGSAVVAVGCSSGLVAWFALPRAAGRSACTSTGRQAVAEVAAEVEAEAEVALELAARLWRLCEGGAVVDLLLLDLRPGQDFKSCGDTGPTQDDDTGVGDTADLSAMVVESTATAAAVASDAATTAPASWICGVDLSTHLCAVVQPRHHASPQSPLSLHRPLLTLVCDGVRRAACGIVVGDDCVLPVPSSACSLHGLQGHTSSDTVGYRAWEYIGAITATGAATTADTGGTPAVRVVDGDSTGPRHVCALLLLVDGALHACALAAPLDEDSNGQSVSGGRRLLSPCIVVGRGDDCSGRFVTACAVSGWHDSDSSRGTGGGSRSSSSSSSSSSGGSRSSSSSSSERSCEARHLCLWLALHNHRTGGTDRVRRTHPRRPPRTSDDQREHQPGDGDGDLVKLLRRLCGTAATSSGTTGSVRVAETSSLIQNVMRTMEAATADEKALRRRVQEADEEVLRSAALLSLLEGPPGAGAGAGAGTGTGAVTGAGGGRGRGNCLLSHVTVHWRVHSALASHPATATAAHFAALSPAAGLGQPPVLTVTVTVDGPLAARALHGRAATVALRPCHLDSDSHAYGTSFTRDLHFRPTTSNPPSSANRLQSGPSHQYHQTHPSPPAHPHQAVVSVPVDCLAHWGDFRLSLTARVPFDPPTDVSMVDDDDDDEGGCCGGVSVVLWEGVMRTGDVGSGCGTGTGTGTGSGKGESLAAVIDRSEGWRAERAFEATLQYSTGRCNDGHTIDHSLSFPIPQPANTATATATATVTTTATAGAVAVAPVSAAAVAVLDLAAANQPPSALAVPGTTAPLSVRHSRVPSTVTVAPPPCAPGPGPGPGPAVCALDPAATVEVLRLSGTPSHLALAHAQSTRIIVAALSGTGVGAGIGAGAGVGAGAGAGAGGTGRLGTNKFVPGDVFSLPSEAREAMDACAKLSQELRAQCSRSDCDTGRVDCHVGPGAGQAAARGARSDEDDDDEEEMEEDEDEDRDIQILQKHIKQLWTLYSTVREKGC